MIVEFLMVILSPLAMHNILRSLNVSNAHSIIISLIYTILLLAFLPIIMVILGFITLSITILIVITALRRARQELHIRA